MRRGGLGGEFLSASFASVGEDLSAGNGRHTGAESVAAFANKIRRLERAFHRNVGVTWGWRVVMLCEC